MTPTTTASHTDTPADKPTHTALITGASAGLGAEFARQLAAQGIHLVLVARREQRLQDLATELRDAYGVRVDCIADDLADPDAPGRIAAQVQALGLTITHLVNNAGSSGPDLLDERDWNRHRAFFELMLVSCAALCHAFLPGMLAQGFGRIINVSSMAGRIPRNGDTGYGPVKAYLVALSEGLHATYRSRGIHAMALCPGFTHTEFHTVNGLTEMKRALPRFLWYDADVVVREGLRALEKGRAVYASGRLYRWADPFLQSVWLRRFFTLSRRQQKKT